MIPLILALTCVPVDGPKLLARHMASAIAEFAQLAPDTDLGHAPLPGVVRVMRADDVQRIGLQHGITVTPSVADVCFQWPTKPLNAEKVVQAMQNALPSEARVEILELSHAPVPEGVLEFPLDRLQGGMWRGFVRWSSGGRLDVWARVRVSVKQTRVVTLSPLRSRDAVDSTQLRIEEFEGAPVPGLVASLEAAAGMISKRALPAGTSLKTEYLEAPKTIAKGDTVRLRATVGVAHVVTEASAQAPGKVGEVIPVKNIASGRILRARIEGPGEVRLMQ